jgi:hypothetical protein
MRFAILSVIILRAAIAAAFITASGSELRADSCEELSQTTWSVSERWTWLAICRDGEADLDSFAAPNVNTALERKVLRSSFVRALLVDTTYSKVIGGNGLRIKNAIFRERLSLSDVSVQIPILLLNSTFEDEVDLNGSHFSDTVSFVGTDLLKGINASQSRIGGSLLLGARDSVDDGGDHVASKSIEYINASGAQIDGDLGIFYAKVIQRARFNHARIKGIFSLHFFEGSAVDLSASDCGSQLIVVDSNLSPVDTEGLKNGGGHEVLNLFSSRIAQSVFLGRSRFNGVVDLQDAQISGSIFLQGAMLSSVNAQNIVVRGSFQVGSSPASAERRQADTTWAEGALLDLTRSSLGVVATPLDLRFWPSKLLLANFSVSAFNFDSDGQSGTKLSRETWLKLWLRRQPSLQPYSPVRKTLQDNGDEAIPPILGYEARDRELRESLSNYNFSNSTYLLFSKFVIGYGYQMWLPVIWVAFFVVIGATIFRRTPEAKEANMTLGFTYSFDALIPLIKLRKKNEEIDIKGPERYYFYVHRLAGWILGTFILAGLAGFTR